MEEVACDYCGSAASTPVARQTDILHRTTDELFTIVRCNSCGLHYLNPRPTAQEIGRYYADDYSFHAAPSRFRRIASSALDLAANSFLGWLLQWMPFVSRRLAAHVKPRIADPVRQHLEAGEALSVLDIGCGAGASAHFWGFGGSLHGYRKLAAVSGVEIDADASGRLRDAGITAYRAIEDVPAEARFDVIRMNWSLEHVHAPSAYFRFISGHLAPGGKAVVAVPNYDGMLYRIAPDCVEVPIHLFHFRKQDIVNYAGRFALSLREFTTFSYPEMYVYAAQICPSLHGLFGAPIGLAEARRMQRLLSRFDAIGLGNDMIAVLEKNA